MADVAAENYFYNIQEIADHPEIDNKAMEREFSKIEAFYADEIGKLLKIIDERKAIPDELVSTLSDFLALQLSTTKQFRDLTIGVYEEIGQRALDNIAGNPPLPDDTDINPSDVILKIVDRLKTHVRSPHFSDKKTLDLLSSILQKRLWIIGINATNQPFYTSDHPVVNVPHREAGSLGIAGLIAGIEINFPLGPHYMLSLLDRMHFKNLARLDRNYGQIGRQMVNDINYLQVVNSYQEIYSNTQNFSVARLFCKSFPEECEKKNS